MEKKKPRGTTAKKRANDKPRAGRVFMSRSLLRELKDEGINPGGNAIAVQGWHFEASSPAAIALIEAAQLLWLYGEMTNARIDARTRSANHDKVESAVRDALKRTKDLRSELGISGPTVAEFHRHLAEAAFFLDGGIEESERAATLRGIARELFAIYGGLPSQPRTGPRSPALTLKQFAKALGDCDPETFRTRAAELGWGLRQVNRYLWDLDYTIVPKAEQDRIDSFASRRSGL